MSNSNLVDKVLLASSTNYKLGRQNNIISEICLHHMAGVLSIESCAEIFRKNNKVSSHYGIDSNGRIGQYVYEENTAYTNGNFNSNLRSVTIEVSNSTINNEYPISENALNSLIILIKDIAVRNNLLPLVKGKNLTWHSMYSNTNCPGKYLLNKIDYIIEKVNGNEVVNVKKTNEEVALEVIKGKWGNGNVRKELLTSAGYDYQIVQNVVNNKIKKIKSNDEIANEVIKGIWNNGNMRKMRLTSAGYNYKLIQSIVNNKLKKN